MDQIGNTDYLFIAIIGNLQILHFTSINHQQRQNKQGRTRPYVAKLFEIISKINIWKSERLKEETQEIMDGQIY